jgi:hypothetical protein
LSLNEQLPAFENQKLIEIQNRIDQLQMEFDVVEEELRLFENKLRLALEDFIIEVQELTVLYKKIKREKKEKRLEQKRRGKNYQGSSELKILKSGNWAPEVSTSEKKERKKLYREAMLNVHPDKFSMDENKLELATDITSNLIEVYKNGSFEDLQFYHSKIMNGLLIEVKNKVEPTGVELELYLTKQLFEIQEKLESIKSKHTYVVLTSYKNPMSFVNELTDYYLDKIAKLKKRTRKVR